MDIIFWFSFTITYGAALVGVLWVVWSAWWDTYNNIASTSRMPSWVEFVVGVITGLLPLALTIFILVSVAVMPLTELVLAGPFKYGNVIKEHNQQKVEAEQKAVEAIKCQPN